MRTESSQGFSLIEVVAAIAVFALGMVALLGLFTPVTKSVAAVGDAEAAARVADAVRARLHAMPFEAAAALIQAPANLQKKSADPAYNPNDGSRNPQVIFGTLGGEAAFYDRDATRPNWYRTDYTRSPPRPLAVPNADKYFEIDLIRNETLSPAGADALAAVIAFNIRVRWPAFVRTSPTAAVQSGQRPAGGAVPFDHSRKQVLFFTGAIRR